jgi:RNA polymerase sigma-70 factor (ECF subfamily)
LTDEQLVTDYRESGDPSLVNELVRRHLARVNALIFQMVLDESVADDLTQEVMLRALAGLHRFQGNSTFGTWLFRIAMNTTYSHLKRQKNSPVQYHSHIPERESKQAGPDETVLELELDAEIKAALDELPPDLRAAVALTSLHGLDAKEAGKVAGCPAGTIYARVHQARKQLRRRLKKWLSP